MPEDQDATAIWMDRDALVAFAGEIGASFSMDFRAEELLSTDLGADELLSTMGELYGLLARKLNASEAPREACRAAVAFYQVRRALDARARGRIQPDTPMRDLIGKQNARAWSDGFERAAGMRIPRTPWRSMDEFSTALEVAHGLRIPQGLFEISAISWASCAGFGIAAAIAGVALQNVWIALASVLAMPFIINFGPWRFNKALTAGDLARAIAAANFTAMTNRRTGCHPGDLWRALVTIVKYQTGNEGPIDRTTRFMFAPL